MKRCSTSFCGSHEDFIIAFDAIRLGFGEITSFVTALNEWNHLAGLVKASTISGVMMNAAYW